MESRAWWRRPPGSFRLNYLGMRRSYLHFTVDSWKSDTRHELIYKVNGIIVIQIQSTMAEPIVNVQACCLRAFLRLP